MRSITIEIHSETLDKAAVGTYILLFNEILALKIDKGLYEVYPDLTIQETQKFISLTERIKAIEKRKQELKQRLASTSLFVPVNTPELSIEPKYKWTPRGMKRNRPWLN